MNASGSRGDSGAATSPVHKSNPLHAAVNAHSNNSSKNNSTASSREIHCHYAGLGGGGVKGLGYGGNSHGVARGGDDKDKVAATTMTAEELTLVKQAYDKVLDIERLSKQGQDFYRSGNPDKAIGSFAKASVVCESLALMHAKGGR